MSTKVFPARPLLFLLFLVIGQSQLGLGQDGVEEDEVAMEAPSFKAVSSHFFRPGTDYKVFFTVNPHPKNESLQLKCVLMANSSQSTTIQSDPISLRPGESGQTSIPLPREMPLNETTWRLFAWSVTERSAEDEYTYEAPHSLIYSTLTNPDRQSLTKVDLLSVFIQTDKPAYKPDDLVRIRVITMGADNRPHLTSGVNISITDSQGNLMKKWEQPLELPESTSAESNVSSNSKVALFGEFQKKRNGLSSYEFQLSGEPILGNWTIQVEAGNLTEKMYFEVKKYILPKFQVKIHAPSVLYGTGQITTASIIKVSYTYGKGLQGTGNVTVSSRNSAATTIQQIVVKDGEATVPLTLSASSSSETVHTITANVTEKNTGRWQVGNATVRVFPRESYSIDWINKPSLYKPGLPLTVQLKITGRDGFPIQEVGTKNLSITSSSSSNLTAQETSISPGGIVTFTLPTPLEPLPANSKFHVQYKKSTYNFTLPAAANGTSSGIFIQVVSPPDSVHLIQGNSYNFSIRSNKPIKPEVFHSLLWDDAAMDVLGAQTIINNRKENATEFPFSLQLPKGDYMNLKVFVYFETEHNETNQTISASKTINTHNYLKIRVSRPSDGKSKENRGSDGISSTAPPPPDAPVETTTTPATTTTTTTTTTTSTTTEATTTGKQSEIEYEYEDIQSDDPAVAEPEPETSDKLQVEPGAAVEIHFETYPDSTIAIRGIDQSLLLLTQQDNDLDQEKVESKRASSQFPKSRLDNISTDNSEFLRTFHRLGICVLNSKRYQKFSVAETKFGGNQNEDSYVAPPENEVVDPLIVPQFDSRLRTEFPETWLWEDFQSSNDSSTTVLRKTLPDTMTSWIISGFSLNPKTGLGVASPTTITGFMPFFVTLNLPYSVIKYESFDLQVIVHNYLDRDVDAFVTLFNRNKDFDFVDNAEVQNENATHKIRVTKDHVAAAHFVITPMKLGDIPIEVSVVTEDGTAGDSMLRTLKVKPEGVRQTRSQTVMFSRPSRPNKTMTRSKSFNVGFPKKVVKGANSVQLTVIGTAVGTMTSNLDHLLRLPGGCGEQNMAKFVPNILALHYLSATNSEATDTMQKARTNLVKGYSHQLLYKQSDGSFSIWKESRGLTWLTAYVLKWFTVAQKYITVDDRVIRRAIDFIRSKQQTNGSFKETGTFYHPEMRGRNGANGVALTAYITLALIKAQETTNSNFNLTTAIEKGMNFISRQSVYDLDDNYITNLVAATLTAGNHSDKTRFFEKMEKRANTTADKPEIKVKYWNKINQREVASGPLAIEMTSYALLAHLWRQDKIDGSVFQIYNWLLTQRNPQGGFKSTQDTVLGLTALTEFALRTKGSARKEDELQLKIRASSNSPVVDDTEISTSVADVNRMVLQEFQLPQSTKTVNLTATGSGTALLQMTESWYVPVPNNRSVRATDFFNISAAMTIPDAEQPTETELRVCVNSLRSREVKDSIESIELPSGYKFDPEDYEAGSEFMAERPTNVQRFELSDGNTKMDVYLSSVPTHPPTCIAFPATRIHDVAGAKDRPIVVYEYLNPDNQATISYAPPNKTNICQLCQSTGACDKEDCR